MNQQTRHQRWPLGIVCTKLWRLHHHQHWARKRSIDNLHESTNQAPTSTTGYQLNKPWQQPHTNQIDHRVLFKQALTAVTHKPNRNCSMHKHKCRPPGIVQSSDKGFTIVSIERKSDLLKTYMNQQTKHQRRPPDIICTKLWKLHHRQHWAQRQSIDNLHESTNQALTSTTGYYSNKPWQQLHTNQTEIVARTSINAGHRVSYKALIKASLLSALSAKAIYWGLTWINKPGTNAGHRVLYERALKVAIHEPNRNRSTHKHNYRPSSIKRTKLWWRLHHCQH